MKPCQPGVCSCHTHLGPHLLYLLFLPLFHYYFQVSILITRHHLPHFHHPVSHSVNDTKANAESKQELLLSRFSRVQLCDPRCGSPPGSPCPRDSLGKSTGVGCHLLLQCMKVKSEREVTQSCPTLSDPMDCSPPGSSVHGIFQARVLEWGTIAFSKQELDRIFFADRGNSLSQSPDKQSPS